MPAALASYGEAGRGRVLQGLTARIKARAIRRCRGLLAEIEPHQGKRTDRLTDGGDTRLSRSAAASSAGLSKRQKVTALRVANVPKDQFEAAIERKNPATIIDLAERDQCPPSTPIVSSKVSVRALSRPWKDIPRNRSEQTKAWRERCLEAPDNAIERFGILFDD